MTVRAPRVVAIDLLRGIVMVLMSIDHASETFNAGRVFTDSTLFFRPGTPLPTAQFLTRWITHLCAPTFVALAGTALAISTEARKRRGESEGAIDRHLVLRGLLLIALELVWMSWVMLGPGQVLLQVLYAIGASLVCMAFLRRLGEVPLLVFGIAVGFGSEIVGDVCADHGLGASLPVALLVTSGFFFGGRMIVAYPLLPWLAMMCIGWAFGRRLLAWRAAGRDERRLASQLLAIAAGAGVLVFAVLRATNGFGNMHLLREGNDLVQWLHVSKYPPSATYTGLELGIAAAVLAVLVRLGSGAVRVLEPIRLLGGAALFYYLLHIHALKLAAWVSGTHGKLGILSCYLGALGVLTALYPACAWYSRYKAAHPTGWARWI